MANVEFAHCHPDNVPYQALDYLNDACLAVEGYCTLDMALAQARAGIGLIYCVFIDNVLGGALFINFRVVGGEKKMTLTLLGSQKNQLHVWARDLVYFLRCLKKDQKATNFTVFGRKGFGKLFPELKHIACVYEGQ